MSSPTKEKQNGVVHFFQHPGSESVVSFRAKISGILVLLIFSIGLSLQAQTINLDSLLSKEELSWLQANKNNIRYAPDPAWPPADYVEDGVHKGFVSDYIRLFEQWLGCDFEMLYNPPGQRGSKLSKRGNAILWVAYRKQSPGKNIYYLQSPF